MFPTKFKNPNKESAPNVQDGKSNNKTTAREAALTEDELKVMNTLIRSGAITKEKYLEDLRKIKG